MIIERVPWNIESSSFKDYKFDTDELMAECCDYDIDVSNINEILSDKKEQEQIAIFLKSNYKLITETYRQLSAISGIELFSIGKNVLNDFLKKANLMTDDISAQEVGIL